MTPVIWQAIGIFSTALAVILLVLLLWRRREVRRTKALKVIGDLQEWGLDDLSRLMMAYAVGNYLGTDSITRVIHEIVDKIQSGGMEAFARKTYRKMVVAVLTGNDVEERRWLVSQVAKEAPVDPPTTSQQ